MLSLVYEWHNLVWMLWAHAMTDGFRRELLRVALARLGCVAAGNPDRPIASRAASIDFHEEVK